MLETIPEWQVYFCRARSFSPARASWSRSPASRWRPTCAVGRGQPTAIPNRLGNQETWGARPILKKLGSCNNTPPLILMVYRTHLWWFWGWFIIALPTLLYFCGLRNAGVSRGFSMLFLASWLGSAFHLWLVPSACSLLEMRLSNLLAMIVRPKRVGSDRFIFPHVFPIFCQAIPVRCFDSATPCRSPVYLLDISALSWAPPNWISPRRSCEG